MTHGQGHNSAALRDRQTHDFFEAWDRVTMGMTLEQRGAFAEICAYTVRSGKLPTDKIMASSLGVNSRKWRRLKDELVALGAIIASDDGTIAAWAVKNRPYKSGYSYKKDSIAPSLRWQVYRRDDYTCVQCGSLEDLTLDHVVSEISGGKTEADNLRTLCRLCNSRKGAS